MSRERKRIAGAEKPSIVAFRVGFAAACSAAWAAALSPPLGGRPVKVRPPGQSGRRDCAI
jgi:hypothetical protein